MYLLKVGGDEVFCLVNQNWVLMMVNGDHVLLMVNKNWGIVES